MSGSRHGSPPQGEEERPPSPSPPPPLQPQAPHDEAYRNLLPKNSHDTTEEDFTKDLESPLQSPARREEDQVPSPVAPPTRSASQSPRRGTGKVNEKENSFDTTVQSTQKGSDTASPKRETSFPASPVRSPLRNTENTRAPAENKKGAKSPGQDEEKAVTHLRSFLKDSGSPISLPERSPGKPAVESPVACELKVEVGGVKPFLVNSGIMRRAALRKTEVGVRVLEVVFCLVSFSVMAANKTSGWAGDSFERYQEFRYCFSVNVMACAYSAFQLYAHFHHRITKRHIISRPSSYYFDLSMDQATWGTFVTAAYKYVEVVQIVRKHSH
ncbi:hypothetical protein HPP92_006176 [Vanilla planifolia]|uniref:CASP-like protein n=1 Tax=Vanilla planifolia TaxID=51239 RepID=A0A835RLL7_VANPL|nr:hypothetical protein HPP92_006176 [Vanilla planifolia]